MSAKGPRPLSNVVILVLLAAVFVFTAYLAVEMGREAVAGPPASTSQAA
jgi:hypothetical protein